MNSTLTRGTTRLEDLEGVLFDFNGTLSDDEGILRDLFIELAATHCGAAITALDYQETLAGRSDREIMTDILAMVPGGVDAGTVEKYLPIIDEEYNARIERSSTISQATRDLVHQLHAAGLKLGVVTGASRLQVIPALKRAGLLDLFGVVVTDEDVRIGKPDPEGFLLAAKDLGLENPERVAAFEDSVPGLGAVKAAGMIAICVAGTHPLAVLQPHASIIIPQISTACLELDLN